MPLSIACIGECMVELSSSGRSDGTWRLGFGGDTFNTLWAIRALIGQADKADYVSAFGDDPFSCDQIAFMKAANIGIAASPVIERGVPGLYAIALVGAERSFTYWRNDAVARLLADDKLSLADSLNGRSLIYFSGITLAILSPGARRNLLAAVAAARADGTLVAFDPNYRPRLWSSIATARAAVDHALQVTDIALPTFPDEQNLYGDASPDETLARLLDKGVEEIVLKNGESPCIVHLGVSRYIDAERVEAIDTTGAGDSFNGGYLAARLLGSDPFDSARRAHRVAAEVVQVRGALAPFDVMRRVF